MDNHKLYTEEELLDYKNFTLKDRSRGDRRKRDYNKALSKYHKDKAKNLFGEPRYNNLHQYSKNKIHCSCLMCAFNGKRHGRIVFKSRTASDKRKNIDSKQQIRDYKDSVVNWTLPRHGIYTFEPDVEFFISGQGL